MSPQLRAVEIIGELLKEKADSVRQALQDALRDENRSAEEHEAIKNALHEYPDELDALARWWKTGKGPAP